jgi:hypothetical protein
MLPKSYIIPSFCPCSSFYVVHSCYTKAKPICPPYVSCPLHADPAIIELNHPIDSPAFLIRQEIPIEATNYLRSAKSNASTSWSALKR